MGSTTTHDSGTRLRSACRTVCMTGVLLSLTAAMSPAETGSFQLRDELSHALAEFDEAQRLQAEAPNQARQLFRAAAQRFHSIQSSGITNGRLEYNLGNCYLQAGDVGRAILHYRQAQRLIPGNERLSNNLEEARSRRLTTIHPTRSSVFLRSVFFWHFQTSLPGRGRTAVVLYVLTWVLLIVRNFAPRKSVAVSAGACALITACAAVSIAVTHWTDRTAPEGVVTAMDVMVHKGPGVEYERQFEEPLQPGVEFTLREPRSDWWRVELADGKSGWIEASRAELIRPARCRNLRG